MQAALQNSRSDVRVIAGMNHLFQPSATGLPSEYEDIETTMSVDVLNDTTRWLDAQ
jgi:hypothetical protein